MKRLILIVLLFAAPAFAGDSRFFKGEVQQEQQPTGIPKVLQSVGLDQRLDQQVNLATTVIDETGNRVQLASFFGARPVILIMAYYECPMLCTQVINGVFGSLKAVPFTAGKDYDVVIVSINPHEKPALAAQKKNAYLTSYHLTEHASGYHFLTADEASIEQITKDVGFRYTYDTLTQQYAHASGIMIATPEGKLSRYFYGIEYAPIDMKLGLMDASNRKIGSIVDQVQLFCYHYDARNGKYGAAIANLLKVGGGLTLVIMGVLFFIMYRRNKLKAQIQLGTIA